MLRQWMQVQSDEALRGIVDEPKICPRYPLNLSTGERCLIGAAGDWTINGFGYCSPRRSLEWTNGLDCGISTGAYFDELCDRFGAGRISRLCQEAALKELVSRRAKVEVPLLVEAVTVQP